MVGFDRKSFGKFQKYDSIYSVFHGTDAFLLEDELNEAQWGRIEQLAAALRLQLNSGFTKQVIMNAANYANFFAIEGTGAGPIPILIDGYQLYVGGNIIAGQPAELTSADNRLIVKLNPVGTANRTDLVLLEAWFEVIGGTEKLHQFGGVDTPELTNEIIDKRLNRESSRRIQFRWRLRTVDNTSSVTEVTALKYDGTDSDIAYVAKDGIYIADLGELKQGTNLKSPGIVYGIPLFTITRNGTDVVEPVDLIDISVKSTPVEGPASDYAKTAANIIQDENHRFVSDTQTSTWDAKMGSEGGTLTGPLTLNADPTEPMQAANKQYVDAVAQGLDVKTSVRATTTENITLSGLQTVDGVTLVADDRVLVKNQTNASENGIYVVATGAWNRATDADSSSKINPGMFTFIEEGTVNAGNGFVLSVTGPITLDTTNLPFSQFSGTGQVIAGTGIIKSGNTLSIADVGTPGTYRSLTVNAQGQVISGTNPTTLAEYGITDAVKKDEDITINKVTPRIFLNSTGDTSDTIGIIPMANGTPIPNSQLVFNTTSGGWELGGSAVRTAEDVSVPQTSTTEPTTNLVEGAVWYNPDTDTAKMYLNGTFREVGGIPPKVSTTEPNANLKEGMVWYNPSNKETQVYLDGGFKPIGGSSLSTVRNTVTLDVDSASVQHRISTFDKTNDILFVYKNSTFIQEDADYTISVDGMTLNTVSGTWLAGTEFSFVVMQSLPSQDVLATARLKNLVTVSADNTINVVIGIPEFNKDTDILEVYQDNIQLYEVEQYTVASDGLSIDLVGYSLNTGSQLMFYVWKKVRASISESAIVDSSITNNKLVADIKVGSLATLNTDAKTSATDAINEVLKKVNDQEVLYWMGV